VQKITEEKTRMSRRQVVLSVASVLLFNFSSQLHAQSAPPPDAYSVTQVNSMMGPAVTMQVYRDGSKALVEQSYLTQSGGQSSHTRTLYDLQAHETYSWDASNAGVSCARGTFSGDWGDPLALAAELSADLAKQHPNQIGAETLNGISTKVMEAETPDGKAKAWVDEKSGLMIKLVMIPKAGQPQTLIEVKQLTLAKPAASYFALPPACAGVAKTPHAPIEAELIAADTGGNAADFANAIMPPPSKDSCAVLLKVVRAGSMEAVTSGFQVAIDTNVDLEHPAHYVMGAGAGGRSTFSGGGLHEVTAQLRDGTLRIENVPPHFDLELAFGKAGYSSALIYRQCFAPQTTLLLVIKNLDMLSDGARWLWVKSGK
jgi:hypothetical protein